LTILLEKPSDTLHKRPGFQLCSTSILELQHMNMNFLWNVRNVQQVSIASNLLWCYATGMPALLMAQVSSHDGWEEHLTLPVGLTQFPGCSEMNALHTGSWDLLFGLSSTHQTHIHLSLKAFYFIITGPTKGITNSSS
jgi:hypothetical protein